MMKFLVLTKSLVGATPLPDPIAALQASKEYLDAMLADGSLDFVYQFASGDQAVAVVNADSAEEIWKKLTAYPLSPIQEYEVHPLADVNYVFEKSLERMQ
jgi:muconolactone delta-isomerase